MATTLDTRPQSVNITHYGGDTLTLSVTAPGWLTDGKEWAAQIRTTKTSDIVDAEFQIAKPTVSGGPAYLTLTSEDSARLIGSAPVVTRRMPDGSTRVVHQYTGLWDCQVYDAVERDPVRTIVQGSIMLEMDVTRIS